MSGESLVAKAGHSIEVDVDLTSGGSLDVTVVGERMDVLFRMAFNQVAEAGAGDRWQILRSTTITSSNSCRCSRSP
ncbi:MAG: hypothetical protein IPF44_11595 [Betaproteobacteria bacterium]|nr:hypothetical protein [Betaproteobacteria bacterium]